MRITNSMISAKMMLNMNNNLKRMEKIQNDITSNVRIHKPSDDPVLVARSLKLHTDLAENDQFRRNIDDAYSVLDKTEISLKELNDVLLRVRDLTTQASNGVLTPEDSKNIQAEVKQLKEQIVKISNDTYVGRHIFSGYRTDEPYLKSDGTNNVILNKEIITEDIKVPLTVNASNDIFEFDIAGLQNSDGTKYTGSYNVELTNKTYNTIEDLQSELQGKLNSPMIGEGISSITMTTTAGDSKMTAGEKVDITFSKALDISSQAAIQKKIDETFGQGNATVTVVGDTATITVEAGKELDLTNGKSIGFKANELKYADGTTNDKIISLRLADDNKTFKVDISNNKLEIKNENMPDSQKFALKSGSFDLKSIGLQKINISNTSEKIEYQIGVSATLPVNVTGDQIFGAVIDSDNDKLPDKTLMDTMNELIKSLEKGDTANISAKLKEIDTHKDNVSEIRGSVGARMNTVDAVRDRIDDMKLNFSKLLSETEDTDMAEAYTQMSIYESVYKASLSVGAKIIQPTLMDFLR